MKRPAQLPGRNIFLIVLATFVLANGLIWSFAIPFDGAPDEIHKYDIVYFIWRRNRLPVFGPQPDADVYIRPSPGSRDGYVYGIAATYPPGALLFSAALMHLVPASDPNVLLHTARLAGVLCNTALAYLAFQIVAALFGSGTYALGVVALIALIPQVAYTGGYVNDDAYTAVAVTWSIWSLIQGMSTQWTLKHSWAMGFALATTLMGKQNGWSAVVPFVLLALGSTYRLAWGERLRVWFRIGLLPVVVFGSWLTRNWILYRDWMPLGVARVAWEDYMTRLGIAWSSLSAKGIGPVGLLTQTNWLQLTFQSFWGRFFYLNVPMPPQVYAVLLAGCAVGMLSTIGIIVSSAVKRQSLFPRAITRPVLLCALLAFVVLVATNIWTNVYNDFQPQGRYFFPLIVPIGIALTLGLYKLQTSHPRAAHVTWGVILIAMAVLNLYALSIVRAHPYPAIPLPNF